MAGTFGSVPVAPAYRAPGGIATDISGGLAAFAQSLEQRRQQAAIEAFRQAQLQMERDKLTQDVGQNDLDRQLKKYIADQQAQVEHERNEAIRVQRERDLSSAKETATRDLRGEFQRQLTEQGKQKVANGYRRMLQLQAKGKQNLTPAEQEEMTNLSQTVGLGQMGITPSLDRADSLAAFRAASAGAVGPLSSEVAQNLEHSLGFDRQPEDASGGAATPPPAATPEMRSDVEAITRQALASGSNGGRILAHIREAIDIGKFPREAEGWVVQVLRQEAHKQKQTSSRTPAPSTANLPVK